MANRKTIYSDKQNKQNRPQHDMAKVKYDSEEAARRMAEAMRNAFSGQKKKQERSDR